MTQIHNVTVLSPPRSRKTTIEPKIVDEPVPKSLKNINRNTKPVTMVRKVVSQESRDPVPQAVSFEVSFPEKRKQKTLEQKVAPKEDEYDDDFESYESDFESSSSSNQEEILQTEDEEESESGEDDAVEEEGPTHQRNDEGGGEEKIESEEDKKLDSGQYDMNVNKKRLLTPPNFESIESSNDNSERTLDSGIGHFGNPTNSSSTFGSQVRYFCENVASISIFLNFRKRQKNERTRGFLKEAKICYKNFNLIQ